VHRTNADVPEDIISGLAELGGFGLSVPEEYGGFATGGESDYMGMVVATEELSRGSLGIGGSLVTFPEIHRSSPAGLESRSNRGSPHRDGE
jgi:(2S)-methylsuccinyl-CoA dehydrogenase